MKCLDALQCEWPQCDCQAGAFPWGARKHGIPRPEWERRFRAHIEAKAVDSDGSKLSAEALKDITDAELESWPEGGDEHNGEDWLVTQPEEAAVEQMSNWDPDE